MIRQSQSRSGLRSGLTSRHLPITSCRREQTQGSPLSSQSSGAMSQQSSTFSSVYRSKCFSGSQKQKGSLWLNISQAMTPIEKISLFQEKLPLSTGQYISGELQGMVNPGTKSPSQTSWWKDYPKSMILTIMDLVIMTFCGLRSRWKTRYPLRKRMPCTIISMISILEAGDTLSRCIRKYSLRLGWEMQSQYRVFIYAVSCRETQYLGMKRALPFLIFLRMRCSCCTRLRDYSGWFSSRFTITIFRIMFSGLKVASGMGPITSFSDPEKTYQYSISVTQMLEKPPELILVRCSRSGLLILMKLRMQLFSKRFLHLMSVGERILLLMEDISDSVKISLFREGLQAELLQKRDSWCSSVAEGCTSPSRMRYFLAFSSVKASRMLDSALRVEGMLSPTPIRATVEAMPAVLGVIFSASLLMTSVCTKVPASVQRRQSLSRSKLQYFSIIQWTASSIFSLAISAPLNSTTFSCPFSGWNEKTIFRSTLSAAFCEMALKSSTRLSRLTTLRQRLSLNTRVRVYQNCEVRQVQLACLMSRSLALLLRKQCSLEESRMSLLWGREGTGYSFSDYEDYVVGWLVREAFLRRREGGGGVGFNYYMIKLMVGLSFYYTGQQSTTREEENSRRVGRRQQGGNAKITDHSLLLPMLLPIIQFLTSQFNPMLPYDQAQRLSLAELPENTLSKAAFADAEPLWVKETVDTIPASAISSLKRYKYFKYGRILGMETTRYLCLYNHSLYYSQDPSGPLKAQCPLLNRYLEWHPTTTGRHLLLLSTARETSLLFFEEESFWRQKKEEMVQWTIRTNYCQQYQEIQPLGEGAFSVVLAVRRREDGRVFAAKKIAKEDRGRKCTRRLVVQERRILGSLRDYRHTSQLVQFYEENNEYIMIMEKMEGPDLLSFIRDNPSPSPAAARAILASLLTCLRELHQRRIIHRDIKPQNIHIDSSLQCKLIDFGLSLSLLHLPSPSPFRRCGTIGYMAPQVLLSDQLPHRPYSAKCDLFSLGIVAHMLLMGSNPIKGKNYEQTYEMNRECRIVLNRGRIEDKYGKEGYRFMEGLLESDARERFSAEEALASAFLQGDAEHFRISRKSSNSTIDEKHEQSFPK